jgi:hypothetical protein
MFFQLLLALLFLLVAGAIPPVIERDDSQPRICVGLPVRGGGCIRCNSSSYVRHQELTILDVRGFDITGVTTEIDLGFPQIKDECECIMACLDSKGTCNNFVWKFTNTSNVLSGHRACTLCIIPLFPSFPIGPFNNLPRFELQPSSCCNHRIRHQ